MHLELAGEIYRGAGGLLAGIVPEFSEHIDRYLNLVKQAGRETAKTGRISAELQQALETPLIPLPDFNRMFLNKVNQLADRLPAEEWNSKYFSNKIFRTAGKKNFHRNRLATIV